MLLAPTTVLFVINNRDWEIIGHKGRMAGLVGSEKDLTNEIAEITGMRKPVPLLLNVT